MNKVTAGSLLLLAQKFAQRSLGVISTLVLARVLTPEDFGILAIAMLALWFVETISATGSDLFIIQKHEVSDEDVNTAWTLDLSLKFVSFLLLLVAAPIVAYARDDYSLISIFFGVALILPLTALQSPGIWLLKREQIYKSFVKLQVLVKLLSLFLVIPAAIYWRSIWAVIFGQIFTTAMISIFSYRISSFRPELSFSNLSEQWAFSKWLIPQAILGYFRIHIDTWIVGAKFNEAGLGAYNNLKYFSSLPSLQIITPISAPLHAELGKVQKLKSEVRFQSGIAILVLGFLSAPIAAMFFCASEAIVGLVLGSQWVPYHQVFAFLGLIILPFVLFTQCSRILMVENNTRSIFYYEIISTSIIVLSLVIFPTKTLSEFAMIKVAAEIILCSLFFAYTTVSCFGRFLYSEFFWLFFPTIGCVFIGFLAKGFFGPASYYIITLVQIGIVIGLSSVAFFAFWFLGFASDRQRRAVKKFSPFSG